MSICLTELKDPDELERGVMRALYRQSRNERHRTWYRALYGGEGQEKEEIALVAIDRRPDKRLGLYELFIPRTLRGRGLGSAVLDAVEHLAQAEGYEAVRGWPRPLDKDLDQKDLERWYRERGYEVVPDGTGEMEKCVAGILPECHS